VPLDLAAGPRQRRQRAVGVRDRVPRVLPRLVDQTGLRIAGLVLDVPVAVEIAVLLQPGHGGSSRLLQPSHRGRVAGPALVLIEDDEEKRRGIRGPVVRRVWTLAEVSQLTIAQLMQDLARLRVPEVVNLDRLVRTEGEQGGPGQLWYERDGLQA